MSHIWLDECGCCGQYHRPNYWGDCRNDAERFPLPVLENGKNVEYPRADPYGNRRRYPAKGETK